MNLEQSVQFLADTISLPSLTKDEEAVVTFVSEHLSKSGWNVQHQQVEEKRFNIFATRTGKTPRILFTTHLDVVPATPKQFQATISDGRVYGRGACDAKGSAVAMISAAEALGDEEDLGLLFVVGEELDGIGAQKAAELLAGEDIQYIVNGEPTDCKLMRAQKGSLGLIADFTGKSCHSGYPQLGVDANRAMIEKCVELYNADFGSSELFGESTVNIGNIQGGLASNVVADSSRIMVTIRTSRPHSEVKAVLSTILAGISYEINYDMEPTDLYTVPGFDTDVASYCSDVPFLKKIGSKMLLYGPGSIHQAHTTDEYLEIASLEHAIQGLQRLYKTLKEELQNVTV